EALGGPGVTGGQATIAGMPTQARPGIFGGVPAGQQEFDDAMARMKSVGPDGADHTRNANGLVFEDQAGAERVYLQGEKDLFMSVKDNLTGTIRTNRAFTIGGNDYEKIAHYQATDVGKARSVKVSLEQVHDVGQHILISGGMSHVQSIKDHVYSETTDGGQVYQANLGIMLRVGKKSAIVMTQDAIVIDAPKVY